MRQSIIELFRRKWEKSQLKLAEVKQDMCWQWPLGRVRDPHWFDPTPELSSWLTLPSLALATRPLVRMRTYALNCFVFRNLSSTSRGHGNTAASKWSWEFKGSLFLSKPKQAFGEYWDTLLHCLASRSSIMLCTKRVVGEIFVPKLPAPEWEE